MINSVLPILIIMLGIFMYSVVWFTARKSAFTVQYDLFKVFTLITISVLQ